MWPCVCNNVKTVWQHILWIKLLCSNSCGQVVVPSIFTSISYEVDSKREDGIVGISLSLCKMGRLQVHNSM